MVAVSSTSTGQQQNVAGVTSGTLADTITINSGDTIAIAFITMGLQSTGTATLAISSVTLGGAAMTLVPGSLKYGFGGTDGDGISVLYYILNPTAGAGKTFAATVTWGGASHRFESLTKVHSYSGALDASPLGTAKIDAKNGVSSMTVNDTLAVNDMLVAICANGSAAPGVTTGTSDSTITGNTDTGSNNMRVAHNTGTGSVNLIFSTNSGDESQYSGVKIIASGGGGASAVPFWGIRIK